MHMPRLLLVTTFNYTVSVGPSSEQYRENQQSILCANRDARTWAYRVADWLLLLLLSLFAGVVDFVDVV